MKKFIVTILISIFSLNSFADCLPQYQKEIESKITKVEKSKKRGKVTTGVVFGTMTAFWGTMGVIMVGPAGVLIGLQFGAFIASPFAGTFYVINKVHRERLENLVGASEAVMAAYGQEDGLRISSLEWLVSEVQTERPEVTIEDIKMSLIDLNESQKLCDGSISKSTMGLKKIKRYLVKNM